MAETGLPRDGSWIGVEILGVSLLSERRRDFIATVIDVSFWYGLYESGEGASDLKGVWGSSVSTKRKRRWLKEQN